MISLVVVNYRSAALAAEAIRSARASSTSSPLQIIVVDNSCDPAEAAQLSAHADLVLTPPSNLGYAGAINLARTHSAGDVLIVSNPDVTFFPGAIEHLIRAVKEQDFAVAGPAFYWDEAREWILPPSDLPTLTDKLSEALASRVRLWSRIRDRRRFRARLAFWALRETTPVAALSGAVMAMDTAIFDRVGGFDERFALYFEENDFLRRVEAVGGRIGYVPAAHCRHVYNQSAASDRDRAAATYAASEEGYFLKWYGRTAVRAVRMLERPRPARQYPVCGPKWELPRAGLVVEASPLASFATAAGHFPKTPSVSIPHEVWESYREEALYLRAVDPRSARVAAACVRYRS